MEIIFIEMEHTRNFNLPMLVPNQSGKEFTHNEALVIIDNFLNNGVKGIVHTPPENPIDGDKYIIGAKSNNDFKDKENQIAIYDNGWRFVSVKAGQIVWIIDEKKIYIFDGTSWVFEENIDSKFLFDNPKNGDFLIYDGSKFTNSNNLENLEKISLVGEFILKNTSNIENYRLENNGNNSTVKVSSDSINWHESFSIDNATGNVDFKSDLTKNGKDISENSNSIKTELVENYNITVPTSLIEFINIDDNYKHSFIFYGLKGGTYNGTTIYCQLGNSIDYIEDYYNWSIYSCSSSMNISSQQYNNKSTSFQLVDSRYANAGIKTYSPSDVEIILNPNMCNNNEKYISSYIATSIFNSYSDMKYFNMRCLGFVYNTEQIVKIKFFLKNGEFTAGKVKHYLFK